MGRKALGKVTHFCTFAGKRKSSGHLLPEMCHPDCFHFSVGFGRGLRQIGYFPDFIFINKILLVFSVVFRTSLETTGNEQVLNFILNNIYFIF